MTGALSIAPVRPYVLMHVRLSVCPYVRNTQRRPLSKTNIFDRNFMKLGHIVQYHNVFFKFDNGPYRTISSGVMAFCL